MNSVFVLVRCWVWDPILLAGQVQWVTRNLEHLLYVQLSTKMSGLCAHVYVQERLLNEAVTGHATVGKPWSCNHHFLGDSGKIGLSNQAGTSRNQLILPCTANIACCLNHPKRRLRLIAGAKYQDMNRITHNFRRRGLLQKEIPKDPATQEEARQGGPMASAHEKCPPGKGALKKGYT